MSIDWNAFDAGLAAYQATLAEAAADAAERSYQTAARPDAAPAEFAYGDVVPGDYMTNEGPTGRWVKVVEVRDSTHPRVAEGWVSVLFEIPEAVTVSGERRYWIDRPEDDLVLIDMRCRPKDVFWLCGVRGCSEQRRHGYVTCETHKDSCL